MRSPVSSRLPALVLAGLLASGCADAPPASEAPATANVEFAPPSLESATALGVPNAHEPLPLLLTAGQVSRQQLDGLAEAGWARFISLRSPEENGSGWEEAYAAGRGMSFTRLPVIGAADLTREQVEALDRILDEAAGEPTVLYCGSANRVGAMLALRAFWLDGATPEEALEVGRAAGMTRLEPDVMGILGLDPASR